MKCAKTRKCKAKDCHNRFEPSKPFIEWCSDDCAALIGVARLDKIKASQARKERVETKRKLDKIKTKSDWLKEAQKAFNLYIRLRAIRFGHTCISSGTPLQISGIGGGFDAGHYRSIGSAPHLRFNLNNVWGQSKQDNRYGSGASFEYRRGLIERRGIEIVEGLEANDEFRKYDIPYLIRIKDIFTRKAKRMKARI